MVPVTLSSPSWDSLDGFSVMDSSTAGLLDTICSFVDSSRMAFSLKGTMPMVSPVIVYSIVGLSGMISCSVLLSRLVFSVVELSGGVF